LLFVPSLTVARTIPLLQRDAEFLPWVENLDRSQRLGLSNGSLYDVILQPYPGSQNPDVSATGFNISCGYIPGLAATGSTFSGGPNGNVTYYNISFLAENLNWTGWSAIPGEE
jgi:hypothetical protein